MIKRFNAVLFLVLAFALVAAACGDDDEPAATPAPTAAPATTQGAPSGPLVAGDPSLITTDPITLTYWNGCEGASCQLEEDLVNEYMATHPNVTVESQQVPMFDRMDKLLINLPAGEDNPIVSGNYGPWNEIFISEGLYAPAKPECMQYGTMENLINAYVPGALDSVIRDGVVYALPNQQNSFSLFINNRLFEEAGLDPVADAPKTWDEMIALNDVFYKEEGGQIVQKSFDLRIGFGAFTPLMAIGLIYQAGGRIYDAAGNPIFNSPEAVRGLQVWADSAVAPEITLNTGASPYEDFAAELVVMSSGGPNALQFMFNLNPELEGNVTVTHMPEIEIGLSPITGVMYSFNMFVNANGTEAEQCAGWNFIDHVLADPGRWFGVIGMVQPKTDWFNEPSAAQFTGLDVAIQDVENSEYVPITKYYNALGGELSSAVERIVYDGQDVQAALDQAVKQYLEAIGGE